MKKKLFTLSFVINLVLVCVLFIGFLKMKYEKRVSDHFDFRRYEIENQQLQQTADSTTRKVVFIGNSITANWINIDPMFFSDNQFVNRGVGGQTSSQILLRFQQDVVNIGATTVVLTVGINDIGEGDGFYNRDFTLDNIKSIVDICEANDIELIITTILPATEIKKNRFTKVKDVHKKIEILNKKINMLAYKYQLGYVDYNKKLRNSDGTFNQNYTFDGLHPNLEGYRIMETLVLEAINKNN